MDLKNVCLFEKEMKKFYGDHADINACLDYVKNEIDTQGLGEINQKTLENIYMYTGKMLNGGDKYTAVSFYLTMNCDMDEEGEIENIDLVIDFAV